MKVTSYRAVRQRETTTCDQKKAKDKIRSLQLSILNSFDIYSVVAVVVVVSSHLIIKQLNSSKRAKQHTVNVSKHFSFLLPFSHGDWRTGVSPAFLLDTHFASPHLATSRQEEKEIIKSCIKVCHPRVRPSVRQVCGTLKDFHFLAS